MAKKPYIKSVAANIKAGDILKRNGVKSTVKSIKVFTGHVEIDYGFDKPDILPSATRVYIY